MMKEGPDCRLKMSGEENLTELDLDRIGQTAELDRESLRAGEYIGICTVVAEGGEEMWQQCTVKRTLTL